MTAGQRFPLPAKVAYPLLSMVAAALVWFAVSRRRASCPGGRRPEVAAAGGERACAIARGKPGDDYWPDDQAAGDYGPEGQYVTYGQDRPGPSPGPGATFPAGPPGPRRCPTVTGAGARGRNHVRRSGRTGTADPGRPGPGERAARTQPDRDASGPGRSRARAAV